MSKFKVGDQVTFMVGNSVENKTYEMAGIPGAMRTYARESTILTIRSVEYNIEEGRVAAGTQYGVAYTYHDDDLKRVVHESDDSWEHIRTKCKDMDVVPVGYSGKTATKLVTDERADEVVEDWSKLSVPEIAAKIMLDPRTAEEDRAAASKARKDIPLFSGCIDYFPLALQEVAKLSKAGNDKHNPGQPMHWNRTVGLSDDHMDALMRHLLEVGTPDADMGGLTHTASVAWRALAILQLEMEALQDAT